MSLPRNNPVTTPNSYIALTTDAAGNATIHVTEIGGGRATATIPATGLLAAALAINGITPKVIAQTLTARNNGLSRHTALCELLWPDRNRES